MQSEPLHTNNSPLLYVQCRNEEPFFAFANGEPLKMDKCLPQGWQGNILAGSKAFSHQGNLGKLVLQEYSHNLWRIRYFSFSFKKQTILRWKESNWLRIQFSLEGKIFYRFQKTVIQLLPGTVNVVWSPNRDTEAAFKKNQRYDLFQIDYHSDLVRQLLPEFPNQPHPAESKIIPTEKEWREAVQQILCCPYDTATAQFFFETRIRDVLLFLLLRPGYGIQYKDLTSEQVRKIHEVDALILQNLRHWDQIAGLAKKVHLSEFKLKIGFKQVIGMNLFERLRDARLERARQLLVQTNMQIKVIHREIGFKSLSGFEEAFKDKFGVTPLKYRKLHQP